ncbi:MAG: hypothetical protein EPN47_08175 [Acidobacteria bacterium]|nr:MAG: hypothetical protein EPN47_08175 [Acidobacteriota bacterium]
MDLVRRVNQILAVLVARVVAVVRVADREPVGGMGPAVTMETAVDMDQALVMAPVAETATVVVMAIPMMAIRMEAGRSEKVTDRGD